MPVTRFPPIPASGSSCWAQALPLTAERAGDLRLGGLEAGPHRLTLSGATGEEGKGSADFDVAVWTAGVAAGVGRVVVGRGR